MFGGEDHFTGGVGGGIFSQLAGFGGGMLGGHLRRRSPREYSVYLKAYSMAMLPGKERMNVSYGGKIIMPPSALATLTSMDLESPWMFKLSNPANPAASTHAGVLEFIAEEGCVHLPYWMMKTLRLNEGDTIRIGGAELPKGKFIKLQAQHVHFLEISDPKAVLEQALRNFSALTQGDIIEISYNNIIFELLIMESQPSDTGISVLDTDLEVDFAAPKGYVEPERPKLAPPSTMASKLGIDLEGSTPGSSRPSSALSGAFASGVHGPQGLSKGGEEWETFKGKGETLSGRKTKGRGISKRKIEDHMEESKIYRRDQHRIVTNDSLESGIGAPAPLNLPFGKLFFGFKVMPYSKPPAEGEAADPSTPSFSGAGNTLSGPSASKGKGKEPAPPASAGTTETPGKSWGNGQTLSGSTSGNRSRAPASTGDVVLGVGGARAPRPIHRSPERTKHRQRSLTPDWGVDDDDIIEIDSD